MDVAYCSPILQILKLKYYISQKILEMMMVVGSCLGLPGKPAAHNCGLYFVLMKGYHGV